MTYDARIELEEEAFARASAFGHRMGPFEDDLPGSFNRFAICRNCGRRLHANLHPGRGQHRIAGVPVRGYCPGARSQF